MLSHTAKGIGKSFTTRSPRVPQDFCEVDRETQGLADALKRLAYTLEEDSLIPVSTAEVRHGIFTVLDSAQVTLKDLATFVERYSVSNPAQTHQAHKPSNTADKVWSLQVLQDWQTLPWTRDGGDICSLRSLLMMHCSTITLATQALQRLNPLLLSS